MRRLLPRLAREGLDEARLARTAARMRRAREALERAAREACHRAVCVFDAGVCDIDAAALAGESEEVTLRVLSRTVMAVGGHVYPPRLDRVERLARWLNAGSRPGCTLGGCRFEHWRGRVRVYRERGRGGFATVTLRAGETALWDGRFHVRAAACGAPAQVRALQPAGWRVLRGLGFPLPARIAHTLPSIWRNGRLLAVPHLNYRDRALPARAVFAADFCNLALLGLDAMTPIAARP